MPEIMMSSRRLNSPKRACKRIIFSRTEILDLAKAWIAISIAFAVILSGLQSITVFISVFFISAFTVGIGFLMHEMAHKFMAQKYDCWAEFRAFNEMLVFAIFMSFFGAVFAAPGAVMIAGNVDKKQNGRIAIAGPLTNLVLALVFIVISLASSSLIIKEIGSYGFTINSWLALFNMIPFWQFDGLKIFKWNKIVYFAFVIAIFLIVFGLPYFMQ